MFKIGLGYRMGLRRAWGQWSGSNLRERRPAPRAPYGRLSGGVVKQMPQMFGHFWTVSGPPARQEGAWGTRFLKVVSDPRTPHPGVRFKMGKATGRFFRQCVPQSAVSLLIKASIMNPKTPNKTRNPNLNWKLLNWKKNQKTTCSFCGLTVHLVHKPCNPMTFHNSTSLSHDHLSDSIPAKDRLMGKMGKVMQRWTPCK